MDNIKGMAWMTLAMLAFALADMFIKMTVDRLPVGEVIMFFGVGGALVFENRIAPVLALGFRHQTRNGFYVAGDLGAIITGFDATSNVNDPLLRAELDDINAVLEDIPVYPYLSISLGFTF